MLRRNRAMEPELFKAEPVADIVQEPCASCEKRIVLMYPAIDKRFYVGTCSKCGKQMFKKKG